MLASLSIQCRVTDDKNLAQGRPNFFVNRTRDKEISSVGEGEIFLLLSVVKYSLLALQKYGFLTVIQNESSEKFGRLYSDKSIELLYI